MLKIAICDDDRAIGPCLAGILRRNAGLLPEPFHIHLFTAGKALVASLPFDIIFLDIELGDITGIHAGEEIRKRNENAVLVFVSAHESYCKELFRLDTTAFLGKPIDEQQVRELISRIAKKLYAPAKIFTYRVKDTVHRVPLADILFFETDARQIKLVTREKQDAFYGKLDEVETGLKERFKRSSFARIHHSFLVNLEHVEHFEHNTLILDGGHILPIAQRKQREIRRFIMEYFSDGACQK
ncbi:MAG: LytTR family DNA-binding domain-containing protein [Treponema sp.]|jgi:DNA-binding LytR/AlgR family response regulator|nr:LytTR family DNA-binding domain-containing protein [Treponema sp.]